MIRRVSATVAAIAVCLAVAAPAEPSSGTCKAVRLYVSAAIEIEYAHTGCRRARDLARRFMRVSACNDETCTLSGYFCDGEPVESSRYIYESGVACQHDNGALVNFTVIVP